MGWDGLGKGGRRVGRGWVGGGNEGRVGEGVGTRRFGAQWGASDRHAFGGLSC